VTGQDSSSAAASDPDGHDGSNKTSSGSLAKKTAALPAAQEDPGEQRWPGGDRVDRLPKRQETITSPILVPARRSTLTSVRVTAGITFTTKSAYSMCRPIG
jgi:hypothetical protein